ncbi:hypothetical protein FACS1894122_08020 [Alphaproteobacteria bacterium]|nr:hypothetical protein FACS1894122_08020 [Alphaproteobacteria bacterium]
MKILSVIFLFVLDLFGMEKSFQDGKQVAEKASKDEKVNESSVTLVPQFQKGFHIDQSETSKAFEYLEKNENTRAVKEIHEERSIYIVDEKEPFMERAENIHKDPNKHLEESDEVAGGSNRFTIEYCEECPDEEYMVTARKTKKRYVQGGLMKIIGDFFC